MNPNRGPYIKNLIPPERPSIARDLNTRCFRLVSAVLGCGFVVAGVLLCSMYLAISLDWQ